MPVGEKLSALRRERGKTLPDVEAATKIMGRMLSALENERWDELPAQVYVRGYIRNYAQFLGVDPEPLLAEYTRDTGTPIHHEHVPLRRIPERTVVPHRFELHALPRQVWIAVAVAIVVVALLLWGISALVSRDDTPPPIAPEATSTAGTTPDDTITEAVTGSVSEGAFILKIEVAEGQSSWLQVRVDDLVAYEGTLPGGDPKMWTVTGSAVVRVGKPAAVTITRDGNPVTIPAAAEGGIAEITLATETE